MMYANTVSWQLLQLLVNQPESDIRLNKNTNNNNRKKNKRRKMRKKGGKREKETKRNVPDPKKMKNLLC